MIIVYIFLLRLAILWTAPEILRLPKRPHKGTPKGDVYSFAIILQEILLRCAPYFYNNMEPQGTLLYSSSFILPEVVSTDTQTADRVLNIKLVAISLEVKNAQMTFYFITVVRQN